MLSLSFWDILYTLNKETYENTQHVTDFREVSEMNHNTEQEHPLRHTMSAICLPAVYAFVGVPTPFSPRV